MWTTACTLEYTYIKNKEFIFKPTCHKSQFLVINIYYYYYYYYYFCSFSIFFVRSITGPVLFNQHVINEEMNYTELLLLLVVLFSVLF